MSAQAAERTPPARPRPGAGSSFGPGLIWAMSTIGQTHVIVATYSGARFGFALLWVVLLAHLLGYPVFEYGARYAVATGETLIGAYTKLPRVRKFVFSFFGILLLTIPFLLLASLLSVGASIMLAAFPQLGFNAWCAAIAAGTTVLIFAGQYRGLEALCLGMSAVLLAGTVAAFTVELPAAAAVGAAALRPALPAGALVALVALMRLPSDPASSIMLSEWAVKKRAAWLAGGSGVDGLRKSLLDMRAGYALSLVVAVIFLSLGAVVLHPRGVRLEGIGLAMQLSSIYTDTVGAWTFPLFVLVTFAAIWGSYYTAADGVPRMFADLYYGARHRPPTTDMTLFRAVYTLAIMAGSLALATVFRRPVFLVVLAVSTGLIAYPLVYVLNIYAVTRLVEPEYRPSRFNLAIAACGVVYATLGATMFFLVRVLGVGAAPG